MTTNYLYDGGINVLEEVDAGGSELARYSQQSLNIDEPLAELRSGTTSFYQRFLSEDALRFTAGVNFYHTF